jgi:hypothetical protein
MMTTLGLMMDPHLHFLVINDVVLPHTADQHLHLFPGPTDATTTAIDLVQMMSTNNVPLTLPVDPLYAIHHRCSRTKRRALHVHGECERPIHQITPNSIVAPRAPFDGGASALTTNQMELLWSLHLLTPSSSRCRW